METLRELAPLPYAKTLVSPLSIEKPTKESGGLYYAWTEDTTFCSNCKIMVLSLNRATRDVVLERAKGIEPSS